MVNPYRRLPKKLDKFGIEIFPDGYSGPSNIPSKLDDRISTRSLYGHTRKDVIFDTLEGELMILEWLDAPDNESQTAEYISKSKIIKKRPDYIIYEQELDGESLIFAVKDRKAFLATWVLHTENDTVQIHNGFIRNNPFFPCYIDILLHLVYRWEEVHQGENRTNFRSWFWHNETVLYDGFFSEHNITKHDLFINYVKGYNIL